jgi:hypothetical protein
VILVVVLVVGVVAVFIEEWRMLWTNSFEVTRILNGSVSKNDASKKDRQAVLENLARR